MAELFTAAAIVGLGMKFLEGIAGESSKKLTGELWDTIKGRFKGRKKAEETISTIEAAKGAAPEQVAKLTTYLDVEMDEHEDFAAKIQQLAQQIQNQDNSNMSISGFTAEKVYQVKANEIGQVGDNYGKS